MPELEHPSTGFPHVETSSLFERPNRSYNVEYKILEPAHTRISPSPIHLPIHSSQHLNPEQNYKNAFVATIEKGQVVGDCVVVSPDGEIVSDGSPNYPYSIDQHVDIHCAEELYPALPPPIGIKGRVLILNSFAPWNYYHWTMDIVPKLGMVDLDSIDLFWAYSNMSFQREYLEAFGIGSEKILPATRLSHWQAQELVYTSAHPRHAQSIDFLRRVAEEHFEVDLHWPDKRRIYISRRDADGRHVANNDEVFGFLSTL